MFFVYIILLSYLLHYFYYWVWIDVWPLWVRKIGFARVAVLRLGRIPWGTDHGRNLRYLALRVLGRSEGFEERPVGFAGEAEPAVGFGCGTNNTAIDNASSTGRYACVSNVNDTLRRATDNDAL